MLLDHVVGHRPAPGDHDDLGPLRPQHGLHRLRGSAGAEHKGLFAGRDAAAPLQKQAEAARVRVCAVQRAVRPPDERVHAAGLLCHGRERRAERHDGAFIGDGHVQPVPCRAVQEVRQPLRRDLEQVIGIRAEHGVNFRGIAVAQVLAQQAAAQARAGGGAAFLPVAARGAQGPEPGCRAGAASSVSRARISRSRSGCRTGRPCSRFTAAMRAATSIRRRYRAASWASSASISCRSSFRDSIFQPPVRRPAPRSQRPPPRRARPAGRCRDHAARAAPA